MNGTELDVQWVCISNMMSKQAKNAALRFLINRAASPILVVGLLIYLKLIETRTEKLSLLIV
jgi:hypothetical protein